MVINGIFAFFTIGSRVFSVPTITDIFPLKNYRLFVRKANSSSFKIFYYNCLKDTKKYDKKDVICFVFDFVNCFTINGNVNTNTS